MDEEKLIPWERYFAGNDGIRCQGFRHAAEGAGGGAADKFVMARGSGEIAVFLEACVILELDLVIRGVDDRDDHRL